MINEQAARRRRRTSPQNCGSISTRNLLTSDGRFVSAANKSVMRPFQWVNQHLPFRLKECVQFSVPVDQPNGSAVECLRTFLGPSQRRYRGAIRKSWTRVRSACNRATRRDYTLQSTAAVIAHLGSNYRQLAAVRGPQRLECYGTWEQDISMPWMTDCPLSVSVSVWTSHASRQSTQNVRFNVRSTAVRVITPKRHVQLALVKIPLW